MDAESKQHMAIVGTDDVEAVGIGESGCVLPARSASQMTDHAEGIEHYSGWSMSQVPHRALAYTDTCAAPPRGEGASKGPRINNPGPPAFQLPDSIPVQVLQGQSCAQSCAQRDSTGPGDGCRVKTEVPVGESLLSPREVCPGGCGNGLLRRPAFESGRLRQGAGGYPGGRPPPPRASVDYPLEQLALRGYDLPSGVQPRTAFSTLDGVNVVGGG